MRTISDLCVTAAVHRWIIVFISAGGIIFFWDTVWLHLGSTSKVEALIPGYSYRQRISHIGNRIDSKSNAGILYLKLICCPTV